MTSESCPDDRMLLARDTMRTSRQFDNPTHCR